MLDHQIDIYNKSGITDINVIVGYQSHKFQNRSIKMIHNTDYENNNILESLFFAKDIINDECIISYSDIIFRNEVVNKLVKDNNPITIVVDTKWKKSYKNRTMHPLSEAEKVQFDDNQKLIKTGKSISLERNECRIHWHA